MKKLISVVLILFMAAALAACGGTSGQGEDASTSGVGDVSIVQQPEQPQTVVDAEVIVSLSASVTRILVDLGLEDKIFGVDSDSLENLDTVRATEMRVMDAAAPDLETIVELEADLVFAPALSGSEGEDAFAAIREEITVVELHAPDSIAGILTYVQYIADVVDKSAEGAILVEEAQASLAEAAALVETVTERPTVYYELALGPDFATTGGGTFLNELIELACGTNVFADKDGWISVSEEDIMGAAPEYIFTAVDPEMDPIGSIISRTNWNEVPAYAGGRLVYIEARDTVQPTHHVVDALWEMIGHLHPELVGEQGEEVDEMA